ncbi:MAG: copper chaperone PCu(A)C [Janthinobacterium lividum]
MTATRAALFGGISLVGALICAPSSEAAPANAVSVSGAWVRWLPSGLPAAGYMTIVNHGSQTLAIVSASSPDYDSAMLHRSVHNGSSERMEMVDKLDVPAHGQIALSPGDYHLMLTDAKHKIAPGDTIHVEIDLSDGSKLDVPMPVSPPGRMK